MARFVAIYVSALLVFGISQVSSTRYETRSASGSPAWYEARTTWTLTPLTKAQNDYAAGLVNINRLKNYILPHIMVARPPGSSGSQYVRRILTILMKNYMKWDVEEDSFTAMAPQPYGATTFTNVIATLNPAAKRRLVLACHYDSKVTPQNFLGAIDSAVPCSMMIEIAIALHSLLGTAALKDELTLQLIFFDGEEAFVRWSREDSLYGSTYLAQKWQDTKWPKNDSSSFQTKLDSIDLLMVLDLLGAPNPRFYDSFIVESKHFGDLVRIEKALYGHNRYFSTRVLSKFVEDDHIPFYTRGVPVLHVLPSPFPRQWHTIKDNSKNLDRYSMERLTKIFTVFVSEYLKLSVPERLY